MKILKRSLIFVLGLEEEFNYEQLYQLLDFAPVSVRGAVAGLKDESLVSVYMREGVTRISLTSVGREQLKAEFGGLRAAGSKRDATWTVCLFLDSAQSTGRDGKPILRPVRNKLLESGFFALERGMYVFPGICPPSLVSDLSRLHALHRVLVFESKRLVVGDERAIVRQLFDIKQLGKQSEVLTKTLTGLSKRLARKEKLHPQTRESFISLLPWLMEFFAQEIIVPDIYFPQEIKLSDIKQLLFQVSAEILPKL